MNSSFGSNTKTVYLCAMLLFIIAVYISPQCMAPTGKAQLRDTRSDVKTPPATIAGTDSVERAMNTICEDRRADVRGTIPIDEMAFAPPFPLTDSRVSAGKGRATALLATAKRLVPFAVRRVAIANGVEPRNLKWMITRVHTVKNIRADVEMRDNATWQPSEPDTIVVGTVFLAGLRSDEAMLAVLAHELTHAINGTDHGLAPVFSRLHGRAPLGTVASENATIELVCEMVGLETVRDYISQTKGRKPGVRQRLGRALQKDCVRTDLSDEDHLSPRETMRMLLQLDADLVNALSGEQLQTNKKTASKAKPPRKQLVKKTRHK